MNGDLFRGVVTLFPVQVNLLGMAMVGRFNPGPLKHSVPSGGHIVAYALTDAGMLNMFSSFTKKREEKKDPEAYDLGWRIEMH